MSKHYCRFLFVKFPKLLYSFLCGKLPSVVHQMIVVDSIEVKLGLSVFRASEAKRLLILKLLAL